jgi:uncharacterized iron-regulated membrane protein
MRARIALRKIHLWLSLVFGLFLCLLCLSGSILVFENEIERTMNAELYKATPGKTISYDSAYKSVLATHPKAEVQRIYTPDELTSKGVYTFRVKEGKKQFYAYVDPGTGKILGTKTSDGFMGFLVEFHHYLLLKDYNGMDFVGYIGIIFFIIILTGIYLWWPGIKNWMRGFVIRRNGNTYVKNYDWHRVIGISFVPFFIMISLTGAAFPFGKDFLGSFGVKTSANPPDKQLIATPLPGGKLPLDNIISAAKETIPGAVVTQIRMPGKPKKGEQEKAVEIRLSHSYDPSAASTGNARVWVDPYSAKVVGKADATVDSSFGSLYQTWLFPLHTGRFGGLFTQVLYAIGGVIPSVLMVTGLVMWRYKARKQGKNPTKKEEKQKKLESQSA